MIQKLKIENKPILISENKNLYNFHRIYKIYDYLIIFKNKTKNIKNTLNVILIRNNKVLCVMYSIDYINKNKKLSEILKYIQKEFNRIRRED